MTLKRTSAGDRGAPMRVVLITLDRHLAGAVETASTRLRADAPGLTVELHAAVEFGRDAGALERAKAAIASADVLIVTMLFLDDHIRAVLPDIEARRPQCDAVFAALSAGEVVKQTRLGRFDMGKPATGVVGLLKRLRGGGAKDKTTTASSGAKQMAMLKRLPKILRWIPGTAQDVRAYFLAMQYWLTGSAFNVEQLVRLLVDRYAAGPRQALRGALPAAPAEEYPKSGVYHPRMPSRFAADIRALPARSDARGTVGLILLRSYLLSDDAAHYDGVIAAMEARGLRVIPVYAVGLDARPAMEAYFMQGGAPAVDAIVSLTGFSLVGGPAYNDSAAAVETLAGFDVPYIAAHALEFQTLDAWRREGRGLSPIEATMMVAIPEIDGATAPSVFGGRREGGGKMAVDVERADRLADRVARMVALRRAPAAERRVAITLFNFPPNAGAAGTAAFLDVFASLLNTLRAMARAGYQLGPLPETPEALREVVTGGAATMAAGLDAPVHARVDVADHVRREPYLREIEAQWGPAPGRAQTDGRAIQILGARFGNVFIGLQPAFGFEGDPMRLLFEKGFAPTHAFSAYYRWIREDFAAHAILHFGTHGALEFMPGKHTGLSDDDWPERLIGATPNFYLYAANNPSEGALAKRRSAATLISYLTPPLAAAGLYKGLLELKGSIERWRTAETRDATLAAIIQTEAAALELCAAEPAWTLDEAEAAIARVATALLEVEYSLIPDGLHVVGAPADAEARARMVELMAEAMGEDVAPKEKAERLAAAEAMLALDTETPGILHALNGGYMRPSPGGDLLRSPEILPTGRNIHGFDPFRIPSAYALQDGRAQAERLLARHMADGAAYPRSVALVLWGSDNLKTEGAPLGQALWLMGARPRRDSYGRLCGAELVPLEELGRPRIDVLTTLSGIFRDLLPLQTRMLAEAALMAARAEEEPLEQNYVRAHALAYQAKHGCDFETAALRVFSNADGAYGSNVNQLIDSGAWGDEDELADAYQSRKCFAYGVDGKPQHQKALLETALGDVDLAYQNLESVELGVTSIDQYFDTLGGVGRAVKRARGGEAAAIYIGDQTRGDGKIRTLSEQVTLETRTRTLNPKWYEGQLRHGYEGVRQIEAHVSNTMGWSATTGEVDPWIYREISQTFVLDDAMRRRLAALNPKASARVANRLIEASERQYWSPDAETLEKLRRAGEELDDLMEGAPPADAPPAARQSAAVA